MDSKGHATITRRKNLPIGGTVAWTEWIWWWRHGKRLAIYVLILRLLGTENGMCNCPEQWYEKPLRVLFFPIKRIKNQLWWWFKSYSS